MTTFLFIFVGLICIYIALKQSVQKKKDLEIQKTKNEAISYIKTKANQIYLEKLPEFEGLYQKEDGREPTYEEKLALLKSIQNQMVNEFNNEVEQENCKIRIN